MMRYTLRGGVLAAAMLASPLAMGADPPRAGEGVDRKFGESASKFEYDMRPDAIVLSFDQKYAELELKTTEPMLRIYGDGRMVVVRPFPFNNAGTFEGRLPRAEVMAILARLERLGVMRYDEKLVAKLRSDIEKDMWTQGRAFTVSDGVQLRIDVHLESYGGQRLDKEIRYWNAEQYGERYKIPALMDLALARKELEKIMSRPGLEKIKEAPR